MGCSVGAVNAGGAVLTRDCSRRFKEGIVQLGVFLLGLFPGLQTGSCLLGGSIHRWNLL